MRKLNDYRRPIRRTRLGSWWDAHWAVRDGVDLADYLPHRFWKYIEYRPQHQHPLPLIVSVEGTEIVVSPNPDAGNHPLRRLLEDQPIGEEDRDDPLAAQIRWLGATNTTEGYNTLRGLRDVEKEDERLTARLLSVGERLDEQVELLEREVASNRIAVSRRRPWVPFIAWARWGYRSGAIFLGLCEAWQFGLPFFNWVGIDASRLGVEG